MERMYTNSKYVRADYSLVEQRITGENKVLKLGRLEYILDIKQHSKACALRYTLDLKILV